jgi:cytochrome c oxidase assembly protein subunit 15
MERRLRLGKWLATTSAIGMFIVLLMGARVTATGSGEGCGNDWPLCHGSWLPADTYESLTEYSHRFVTGIEGMIVLATTIVTWPMRKRFPAFTLLVPLMACTLVLQSLMGAAAVRWPQSAEVMATHFGISLICLASAALLARVITQSEQGRRSDGIAVSPGYRWYAVALVGMSIVTAYAGAYVRHTESELACSSWPTCNGQLIPSFAGPEGNQTLHRLAALAISLMVLGLLMWTWKVRASRPDLFRIAFLAMGIVLAQSLVGREVIYSGLALMATLSHAGLMAILFVLLCENVRAVWPTRAHAENEVRHLEANTRALPTAN